MKKLLILLLLSSFAYADMDRICSISLKNTYATALYVEAQIRKQNCERNNVLELIVPVENEYTRESLLMFSNHGEIHSSYTINKYHKLINYNFNNTCNFKYENKHN